MCRNVSSLPGRRHLFSFTLVELLVVIAVIAILAAITIGAAGGLSTKAARNRATAEIQALSAGLEGYKTDNGTYPVGFPIAGTGGSGSALVGPPSGTYPQDPSVSGGTYTIASQALFEAMTGRTNFADTPATGVRAYCPLKITQVGNATATAGSGYSASGSSYVQDPWGYPYGYSTGDANTPQQSYPYNGSGLFDLWTTAGTTGTSTANNSNPTNTWIVNWK